MVDKAISEKHCHEDAIPEEMQDEGVSAEMLKRIEKEKERMPKEKVFIDGYELP